MKYKKKCTYLVNTGKQFFYEDERVCFELRNNLELNKFLNEYKEQTTTISSRYEEVSKAPVFSGVYLLTIEDKSKGLIDVAYIGSSICLNRRLYGHQTLNFLHYSLHPKFILKVHLVSSDKYRSLESNLIGKMNPFLNKEYAKSSEMRAVYYTYVNKGMYTAEDDIYTRK
jgi:hypothetical protein